MKKKNIFILLSTILVSTSISLPVLILDNKTSLNNELNKKAEQVVKEFEKNNSITVNDIIPADRINNSPILVESTGPIVSYGSIIYGLDWYAGKRWEINLMDLEFAKYFPGGKNDFFSDNHDYPKRAFRNWTLDVQNNELWILTNSMKTQKNNGNSRAYPQTILKFNSLTGEFKEYYQMPIDKNFQSSNDNVTIDKNRMYEQIAVLKNGNVLIYSLGDWFRTQLLDVNNKTFKINDSKTKNSRIIQSIQKKVKEVTGSDNDTSGTIRLYNLVPVGDNANIAILGSILYGQGDQANASGDLYLALVDDNLNSIDVSDSNSPWSFNNQETSGIVVVKNPKMDVNSNNQEAKYDKYVSSFSRSYYYTIDGNVVVSMFSKFFIFKKPSTQEIKSYGVRYASYDFGQGQEISSFTMDVNGNIFYKLKQDTKIYKMMISVTSIFENTNFTIDTYYDISSNNDKTIRDNAENFILYNVKGYSGSIMLINTNNDVDRNLSDGNPNDSPNETSKNWGLALAITPNTSDQQKGDSLGLLNSDKSILKTADFEINTNVLSSKIPSEITREDVTIKNDAFFTRNSEKNEDGSLKYPPFKLEKINDENGTFDVVVNLDQIPWFATTLPTNAVPKTIKKTFDTNTNKAQTISKKVSWKDETSLSYDFKNTLPSKTSVDDLNQFDPFLVSFSSRTVLDSNGNQIYPKKTYKIISQNDTNGQLNVQVKYDYMPVSSEVDIVQSYTTSKIYNLFTNSNEKKFRFAGAKTNAQNGNVGSEIDVNNVPQLKYLAQSSILPSSFNSEDKSQLLNFVDTANSAGFPLSRMNFEINSDDENGKLTIIATMPSDYYGEQYKFTQTYTGLNKKISYNFDFVQTTQISGKNFSTMLPSSVNEGNVINDLISYEGFNSNDFTVNLYPNNEIGSLNIRITLDQQYPNSLIEQFGFKNHSIEFMYTGFMTNNEFNSKYLIEFYNDSSKELIDLKKMTLSDIESQLKLNKLTVGSKTYTNLNQLVEELLIKFKGSYIPTSWKDKSESEIKTEMFINNEAGTMNISVTISKKLLPDSSGDINFVASYSGFAKGNKVITNDSLSFVSNELLAVSVEEVKNMNVNQMKDWLIENNENINKIIFNATGVYEQLIKDKKYKLNIETNESYNSISIEIVFDRKDVPDQKSLISYSIQYILTNN